jgi:hypothetical protein
MAESIDILKIKFMIGIIFIMLLIPTICYSQQQVSDQIYGFNMPIELDKDTIYKYVLDNNKCTQDFNGVNENGGCNYMNTYPYLYFSHQFSMNCCTEHFYQIEVRGDSILITHSETGDFCLCGNCTYELTFSDQNTQKLEYHILMAGKDTTVLKLSSIQKYNSLDKIKIYYNSEVDGIYINNEMYDNRAIKFTLFDFSGRVILNRLILEKSYYVNTNSLQPGIYIVQTNTGLYFKSEKILIQK